LGLIVPREKEACRIRVGPEIAHWEEGRSVVFDDTYLHEVWNDTDEERVVLFVDFARPLPFPVSLLNEAMIRLFSRSGYVQEIVENVHEWNRQTGTATTGKPSDVGAEVGLEDPIAPMRSGTA
jgi:beta-hydroxylase